MIKEWFNSIFTHTKPVYRKLGYVYSSVALQARFSRCEKAWSSHIENCHAAVREALDLDKISSPKGSVLVVGSGPLYEVPLPDLLNSFEKIVLVDVVHPRAVYKLAKKHPQIELRTFDVTGFAAASDNEETIQKLDFAPPVIQGEKFVAVISANILSQLALEPYAAARKKKWKWANDSYFKKLARKMSADHGKWLKSLGAKDTILFSDIERIYFDREKKETERLPSAGQMPLGLLVREWDWEIAPLGEVSRQFSYSMKVVCRRL